MGEVFYVSMVHTASIFRIDVDAETGGSLYLRIVINITYEHTV
jgi:hypothetical protein